MLLGTYRGILEDISGVDGTYKQQLKAIAEGGGGGGGMLVITTTDSTLDKTWQEIYDAMADSKLCVIFDVDQNTVEIDIVAVADAGDYYTLHTMTSTYIASTANDYPVNAD